MARIERASADPNPESLTKFGRRRHGGERHLELGNPEESSKIGSADSLAKSTHAVSGIVGVGVRGSPSLLTKWFEGGGRARDPPMETVSPPVPILTPGRSVVPVH